VLIVRAVFGGIEVIVPANWEVKSEVETIFGSTQDERSMRMHDSNGDNKKMLILRGSCVFGGVEIKSI
jgi:predicted membrane protein